LEVCYEEGGKRDGNLPNGNGRMTKGHTERVGGTERRQRKKRGTIDIFLPKVAVHVKQGLNLPREGKRVNLFKRR